MKHISLFTGIGGFEIAAQRVWGDEYEPVLFCEMDKYCQKVLKKHWPDVPIVEDVRDVKREQPYDAERTALGFAPQGVRGGIDLLTGGFPCQPFSQAGEQKGTEDDRYLWPEMFGVIKAFRPNWVVAENVTAIDGVVLDNCIDDLETFGYEVAPPLEIPACAVGAGHQRNRVWIIAHSECSGREGYKQDGGLQSSERAPHAEPGDPILSTWDQLGRCRGGLREGDGLSVWMVRSMVKAFGNAIVPAVAEQIFRAIKDSELRG